jgi:hypothetical protein
VNTNKPPTWVFEGLTPAKARALMLSCGLTASQADRALAPANVTTNASVATVRPPDDLVVELSPQTRAKFYGELARFPLNQYMAYPFCYPKARVDEWFGDSAVAQTIQDKVKKLFYVRGNTICFSDFEPLSIPSVVVRHYISPRAA